MKPATLKILIKNPKKKEKTKKIPKGQQKKNLALLVSFAGCVTPS